MRSFSFYIVFCCYWVQATAQLFQPVDYPKNIFRNPLDIPISLAANFGELRSNHYHMGLDIRTQHRENLPVYAAADGSVMAVRIEPFGFGQALYIRHPQGYVTLYAHLNAFNPALAAYVKKRQYELERWDVFLEIPDGLFPVNKGDLIAYSGNMGGSQGPHLHFEIRDAGQVNLNPMLFGLPIADNTPPVVRKLAVYDRNSSIYEQSPLFLPVTGKGADYRINRPVLEVSSNSVGFGISGFDTQSGSANPNGIYQAIVYDQDQPVSGFQMNHISYSNTRGINAHIDYRMRAAGGPYYQLLFPLPGYDHSIYQAPGAGYIRLRDGRVHDIRIELKDPYGNTSNLKFKIRFKPVQTPNTAVEGKMFYPFMVDGFESDDCAFYLGERSLYDSVHLAYHAEATDLPEAVSRVHRIGSTLVPLQDSLTVRIKITRPGVEKSRVLMQRFTGNDEEVKRVEWQGDWATASFRSFGNFQLVLDTDAPRISFPGIAENANLSRSSRIAVLVRDNHGLVSSFRATLDGHWLLFSNDKARAFLYHFDEHCAPGRHELKIQAMDVAGNSGEAILHFIR